MKLKYSVVFVLTFTCSLYAMEDPAFEKIGKLLRQDINTLPLNLQNKLLVYVQLTEEDAKAGVEENQKTIRARNELVELIDQTSTNLNNPDINRQEIRPDDNDELYQSILKNINGWPTKPNAFGEDDNCPIFVSMEPEEENLEGFLDLQSSDSEHGKWKCALDEIKDTLSREGSLSPEEAGYITLTDFCSSTNGSPEDRPLLFLVIHNATSDNGKAFKKGTGYYAGINDFALSYAQQKEKDYKYVSYSWSGNNVERSIIGAGSVLLSLLHEMGCVENTKIIAIAHGPSCNVANFISGYVPENPIELLIFLACPEPLPQPPLHYNQLIHFCIDNEWNIGGIGAQIGTYSVNGVGVGLAATSAFVGNPSSEDSLLEIGGKLVIKSVLGFVGKQLMQFKIQAPAKVLKDSFGFQRKKITVSIWVLENGVPADYRSVKNVLLDLRVIIERLLHNYPTHYLLSSSFDLDINHRDGDRIVLLIQKQGPEKCEDENMDCVNEEKELSARLRK